MTIKSENEYLMRQIETLRKVTISYRDQTSVDIPSRTTSRNKRLDDSYLKPTSEGELSPSPIASKGKSKLKLVEENEDLRLAKFEFN